MLWTENRKMGGEPLTFLGRGAAFNPTEGNTAAYIREEDRLLLLDCGETVFERLISSEVLTGLKQIHIAISHTHSDHCGSLGSLVFYCFFALEIKAHIVLPADEPDYADSVRLLLKQFGIPDAYYVCEVPSEVTGFRAISSFRFVKTVHDPHLTCFSFELETPEGGVFYSADTCRTDELTSFLESHDQIAAIYMEATEFSAPGNIHLSLDCLRAALPEAAMEKTHLMHLSSKGCMEKAMNIGFMIVDV